GNGDFLVGSEDGAQGIADFAQRRVGFDGFVEVRHEVFLALGGPQEAIEPPPHLLARALLAQLAEPLLLAPGDALINLQDFERFFLAYVAVYTHDDLFFAVHGLLILVRSLGNFALRIRTLDRRDHTAQRVNLANIFAGALLDFVR